MIRKEKKDDLVSSVPSRIVTAWASGMTRFGATIPGRRPLLGLAGKPAFTHQALSPNHVAPPPHRGLACPQNPGGFPIWNIFIIFQCDFWKVTNLASVTHEPSGGEMLLGLERGRAEISRDRGGFL